MLTDKQRLENIENSGKENRRLEVNSFTDNDIVMDWVKNLVRVEKENIRQEFTLQLSETINEFKHISNSICKRNDEKNFETLKHSKEVESQVFRLNNKLDSLQNVNNFFGNVNGSDQKAMSANLDSSPENTSYVINKFDQTSKSIPNDKDNETHYNLGRSTEKYDVSDTRRTKNIASDLRKGVDEMKDFYEKQSEYFYNIKDNLFNLQEKVQK